jgi:hypothetical protein
MISLYLIKCCLDFLHDYRGESIELLIKRSWIKFFWLYSLSTFILKGICPLHSIPKCKLHNSRTFHLTFIWPVILHAYFSNIIFVIFWSYIVLWQYINLFSGNACSPHQNTYIRHCSLKEKTVTLLYMLLVVTGSYINSTSNRYQ